MLALQRLSRVPSIFACLVSSSKCNTKQKFKHRTLSRSVPTPMLYHFTKHNTSTCCRMSIAAAFTYLWRRYMGSARYNSILTCESRAMVSELIHPIDIHTTVCLVHSVSKVESGYHHAASLIQRNACSHQRQYILSRDKQIKSIF